MINKNKTIATVLAGALTALTCAPALAMDLRHETDQNVMAYWTFDLGGDKGRTSDRQSFGLTVNAPLADNLAYNAYKGSSFMHQPSHNHRASLMDLKLGFDGAFHRLSLNGNKIVDQTDVLYADEEGGPMTILGVEWYYALFAALGAGAAGYLIYDTLDDDDDDDAAAASGGGGTTGTPLDVVLDPLAGLAP